MQNTDSQKIVVRVFEAVQRLKEEKVIRGTQTFTNKYNINRRNFITCRKNPDRDIFQAAWLAYLVEDFKVSPVWLITGEGGFYQDGWTAESVKNICKTSKKK